jgi:hypothetical protein
MKLLDLQQKSLDHMETIRTIIEQGGSRVSIESDKKQTKYLEEIAKDSDENLKIVKESAKEQKAQLKADSRERAAVLANLAESIQTFKSPLDKLKEGVASAKEKYGTVSGLKTTVMEKLNVGGILTKSIEKEKFVKEQRDLGSTAKASDLRKQFDERNKLAIAIKANEAQIERYRKMGLSEKQLAGTAFGSKLLEKRESLTSSFAGTDLKAKFAGDEGDSEAAIEQARMEEENLDEQKQQTVLLEKIAQGLSSDVKTLDDKKSGGIGDFLGSALTGFANGFSKAIGMLFNPRNLLKVLSKVFAPVIIIGSLVSGIMDGFKAWKESGSISEALIAGLGGILEFLSFGLINKDDVKKIANSVGDFVNEYIVEPISNFFKDIKDGIIGMIQNIGIPQMKFTIPVLNKEVSVGPYYPFKDTGNGNTVNAQSAMQQTPAAPVVAASAENAGLSVAGSAGGGNTVVAPVTNNSQQIKNVVVKLPTRNQDSSYSRYLDSMYVAP